MQYSERLALPYGNTILFKVTKYIVKYFSKYIRIGLIIKKLIPSFMD